VSFINWALYAGCVVLVIVFRSSSALASAYGLAVSGVMVATSVAVVRLYWKWSRLESGLLFGALAAIDASFLLANSLKFLEGGFVPLAVGIVIFLVMVTWRWGRKATFAAYSAKHTMTMAELVRLKRRSEVIIDRNAVLTFPSRCAQSMTTPPRCCSFFGSATERCPGTSFSSRSCIARRPITMTTATT
jgi:KUP system potassium uptake protein